LVFEIWVNFDTSTHQATTSIMHMKNGDATNILMKKNVGIELPMHACATNQFFGNQINKKWSISKF
jgi:hypothetical protein